jgi:hypothetical protein
MHPLFDKNEERLREHDSKVSRETEEQKRKTTDLAGFSTPAETGGSDDSAEVIVVYGSAKKRRLKIFTRENTGKKYMEGEVRRELIMERLVKEIRLDREEDPGNGRVETSGATRDKYWNFERVYYVWTTECVGGHNSSKKRKGQPHIKER